MNTFRLHSERRQVSIRIWINLFLALIISGLFAGCLLEPDRNNINDPWSRDFEDNGEVVLTINDIRNDPISGAQVRLLDINVAKYTDLNGNVEFPDVPEGTLHYEVQREKYATQWGEAIIERGETTFERVNLNGKPFIDSIQVRSRMVQTGFQQFNFGYEFTVFGGDLDGRHDLTDLLVYKPGEDEHLPPISGDTIMVATEDVSPNLTEYYTLLGRDFRFVLYDEAEDSVTVARRIFSFLKYEGLSDDMLGSSSVFEIGQMRFKWLNLARLILDNPPATYRLEVFRYQNDSEPFIDTLVTFVNPGETSELSIEIYQTEGFQAGTPRFWQLTMYDQFGNYVRSLRQSFTPTQVEFE
jgi:hypothetical protein